MTLSHVPVVSIVTSHGRQPLAATADERLVDLLGRHDVPWSAVSIYAIPRGGGEARLCSGLDLKLSEFPDVAELILYFNRNVNPFMFSLAQFKTIGDAATSSEAAEYFYQKLDNAKSSCETFLKKLTPDECREVIAERVGEMIRSTVPAGSDLVVGVSGGGDSNALLYGLSQLKDHPIRVHPIIIKGIPDWDAGVPRAEQLCQSYGLELTVMEEPEVRGLLQMSGDGTSLVERFEREFPGDDFEFVGTLLIRLALSRRARQLQTRWICTGVNLEDALCENLFRVSTGLKPASFPNRAIGDVNLVYPLWLCPKRIIDGCFPKYSLQNYDARYPCFSLGRNLYYSVIYALQSQFPGFPEQLARGLSDLAKSNPVAYHLDEQLGFYVERFIPFPLRQKFKKMMGESTVLSADRA